MTMSSALSNKALDIVIKDHVILKIYLKIENCLQYLRFGVFSDETVPSSDFLTKQIVRNSNWYV